MAEGPFSNAGLGMFGTEKSYISKGMTAEDKNGTLAKLLGLATFQPAENPYAMQQAVVPPSAAGQGVSNTAIPGGIGINPQRRSGLGFVSNTGLRANTLPSLTTGPMPEDSAGTGLDIKNSLNAFWGV